MAKKSKRAADQSRPEAFFDDVVEQVVEQLKTTLLATYDRRNTGAFTFGLQGLAAVATEQLTQARNTQDLYNAATFVLAGLLLMVRAYELRRKPVKTPEPEDTSS